jgi:tRNA threonylcarbamoyl adenosine modification protein YeaZ
MSLTLAVETSSAEHSVALGYSGLGPSGLGSSAPRSSGEVLIRRTIRRDDPSFAGVGPLVASALAEICHRFADIGRIGVDVGPGNLASVRAGVAYANGLAFSLGLPVHSANALELMAIEADETETETDTAHVLCLRNAGSGNVYAGLFRGHTTVGLRHGPFEPVVAAMVKELREVSVAGAFRQEVARTLPRTVVKDTGIEAPDVLTLHRVLVGATSDRLRSGPAATPLNEMSTVFEAIGG